MLACPRCGAIVADDAKVCNACGEPLNNSRPDFTEDFRYNRYKRDPTERENFIYGIINDTEDTTNEYDPQDIMQNKNITIFAYLGILLLIPLFGAPNSRFARFHINQGLTLLILDVAVSLVLTFVHLLFALITPILGALVTIIITLVNLVALVYLILGILNVVNGRAKELPFIGRVRIISY